MKETFHVHNAGVTEPERWGDSQTLLVFRGESCGHGYRKNEAHIFMDKCAIARLKEKLDTLDTAELLTEPPIRDCLGCKLGALTQANFCSWCGEALK